jgi:hypothetical protein
MTISYIHGNIVVTKSTTSNSLTGWDNSQSIIVMYTTFLRYAIIRTPNPIYMAPSDDERERRVVLSYLIYSHIIRIFRISNGEFPPKCK